MLLNLIGGERFKALSFVKNKVFIYRAMKSVYCVLFSSLSFFGFYVIYSRIMFVCFSPFALSLWFLEIFIDYSVKKLSESSSLKI